MAEFDTGYSLVPSDGEVTADARLEAALSGLVPANDPDVEIPLGRGWAFDFQKGEFVEHGNSPAEVSGFDQIYVWVQKTLLTARLAHPVYSDDYGVDNPWELYGRPFTRAAASVYAERIKDALLVHDRITTVTDFTFDGNAGDPILLVSFTVLVDDDALAFTDIPVGST